MADRRLTDQEVKAMRRAGISVPESDEEVARLLAEGEASGEPSDLREAFDRVRESLRREARSRKSA